MKIIYLTLLLAFAACALASFLEDWNRIRLADGAERLTFHVAIKQRNIDQLERLLYAVSDPDSPSYGKHATKEYISALIAPSKEEVDYVKNFFVSGGVSNTDIEVYDDALRITTSIDTIKAIFGGNFHWYTHGPTRHTVIRAGGEGIVIPSAIMSKIDFVTGLVSFPIIQKQSKSALLQEAKDVADGNYGYFAPSTLRTLYSIPDDMAVKSPKSSQCAMEFAPEGAMSFADYAQYCKLSEEKFFNYSQIVGPFQEGIWGNTESELDVQLLGTIGSGAVNWFWTVQNGWIWEMATEIYNKNEKPYIYSISYGWPEVLTCNSAAVAANCTDGDYTAYIGRANTELMKLGTMGYTIITCSQDEGAPSSANMGCSNDTHPVFGIYPGSSPYATTVSGTTAGPESAAASSADVPPICDGYTCDTSKTEVPCMPTNTYFGWTTGGGFSEISVRPPYQNTVVTAYVNNNNVEKPPAKYYWPNNRGYPDVSAIGARVLIVSGGSVTVAEGTSASTPIFAGIVTLLNDYRLSNNKSPLGFLNPVLYKMPASAFKDITTGNNKCTEGSFCCDYGYAAGQGWDAVTGLGTPNFAQMLTYVQTLP